MTREADNPQLSRTELVEQQELIGERLMRNVFADQTASSMLDAGLGGFASPATLKDITELKRIRENLESINKPQGKPEDNGTHAQ